MAGPQKLVAFMPWLWLEKSVSVAGFTFAPFLDKEGLVAEPLAVLKDTFPVILSSYCDIQQRPRETCVVVTDQTAGDPAEPWNLSEDRIEAVRWASSLLFLASWAANDYFTLIGSYVNDTNFQLYFQRFTEPPEYVSLSYRRRDGRVLYGGPKHGQMHSTVPLYASSSKFHVEAGFLAGLNAAVYASFVEMANPGFGHALADGLADLAEFVRLLSHPGHDAGRTDQRGAEQIAQGLRGSILRDELLDVEIDRRRLDALAILGRRDHPFGKRRLGYASATLAAINRRLMFRDHKRTLGKVEDLALLDPYRRLRVE